jgi:hypothetical protein
LLPYPIRPALENAAQRLGRAQSLPAEQRADLRLNAALPRGSPTLSQFEIWTALDG